MTWHLFFEHQIWAEKPFGQQTGFFFLIDSSRFGRSVIISAAALKSHSVVTNIERMILMYWRQKNRPAWLTFFVTSPWSWLGVQDAAGVFVGKKKRLCSSF